MALTRHQQEVIAGYIFLTMCGTSFSRNDIMKVINRLPRALEKDDATRAAAEGKYWLAAAEEGSIEYGLNHFQ